VVAPPPIHLVKRRAEAVNLRAVLIDSVAASAVSDDLRRPEVEPQFEVVQDSAAPVGLGPEGNHDGRHGEELVEVQFILGILGSGPGA
jgi:hypothetical protein